MNRRLLGVAAALSVLVAGGPWVASARPPDTWDGLTRITSKRFDAVYLLPGADFRSYKQVMLDPTEVAFEKNWLRDYNNNTINPSDRISNSEAQGMLEEVRKGFEEIFRQAWTEAGYTIVQTPGPDVIRVRTGVVNLHVAAPERMTAGRSRTFTQEAGSASLIVEVRDSMSGAVLGRAVDSRVVGDTAPYRRNSVTNRSDFTRLFKSWSKISIDGLAELRARSPIGGATEAAAK